jgi:hypothetical protein
MVQGFLGIIAQTLNQHAAHCGMQSTNRLPLDKAPLMEPMCIREFKSIQEFTTEDIHRRSQLRGGYFCERLRGQGSKFMHINPGAGEINPDPLSVGLECGRTNSPPETVARCRYGASASAAGRVFMSP